MYKYMQSLILALFFGAWMLQSVSPLGMHMMIIAGSHSEVMACSIDGDCDSSTCSVTEHATCSCRHASAKNRNENPVTLCGCNHHGNEAVTTASVFQIKAPITGAAGSITFPSQFISPRLGPSPTLIFKDDIFHPPRLSA